MLGNLAIARPIQREMWIAVFACLCTASGLSLTLAGSAMRDDAMMLSGAGVLTLGITMLLAARLINGLTLVTLSLPLPAMFADEALRITLAAPLTLLVVFLWFVVAGATHQRYLFAGLPMRAISAVLAVLVLAAAFGQDHLVAARELTNLFVLFGLLVAATDILARERGRIDALVRLLAVLGGVTGGLAVLEGVQLLPGEFPRWGTDFNRAALGFGQPNALGLYLAVSLPLIVHEWFSAQSRSTRWMFASLAGCTFLGLLFTFSRGSLLALAGGGVAFLFVRQGRWVWKLWGIGALALLAFDLASGGAIRDTIERTFSDWLLEQRAALVLAGVAMAVSYPILGVGPGGFEGMLERFGPQLSQLSDYKPTPHNAYVQVAAETGLIGLVVFLVFLWTMWRVMSQRALASFGSPESSDREQHLWRALLWSFAVVCLAGMVVWPFAHGAGQAVMLVMAIASALPDRRTVT